MYQELIKDELAKKQRSIITIIDLLLLHAESEDASDIHIDPTELSVEVRFRRDGLLEGKYIFDRSIYQEIILRLKILSRLRTDEHFSPQDGRFKINKKDGARLDIRISIIPTYFGENAVLRLLRPTHHTSTLEDLGLEKEDQEKISKVLAKNTGMILVTGPTGSGKTTTVYTLLGLLNSKDRSLVTIEDPIEYAVSGIRQIQTHKGLTFANGLRSLLRQDPDIIMVGEIRDGETASIATHTALTGHLLLSTLHTTDAVTVLPRLLDMKIDGYVLASTIEIIIAQRLIRKLCEHCKKTYEPTPQEKLLFKEPPTVLWTGMGCDSCNHTGYKGRIGVYEVLATSPPLQEAIANRSPTHVLRKIAHETGMKTLLEHGLNKVLAGKTTTEEVLSAVS